MNSGQLVSIIITTRNEAEMIGRLLISLKKQKYKNKELILVDNNSQDDTTKIAKSFDVQVHNFGPERSAQRNYGASKANGKYILFLDADMKLSPDVLSECVNVIQSEANVGGVIIPEASVASNFWEKVKAFERSFYNEKGDITTDAARFFEKEVFQKVGGYDESITGPEDWDLPETIKEKGYKIGRIKSIIYHYERINSPFSLARKKFYYALKAHNYLKKHKISVIGSKTVFFLRPVFYKNWKKLVKNPSLSLGMITLLTLEQIAGAFGYIYGRILK